VKKIKYIKEGKVVKFINDLTFKSVLSDSNCKEALCLLLNEVTGCDTEDLFNNIKIINSEHPILKQGLSEGINKVAKNMLKLGKKIEEICKATGLSINQIKML